MVWMPPLSRHRGEISGGSLARRLRERLQPKIIVVGRNEVERNDGRSVRGPCNLGRCSGGDHAGRIEGTMSCLLNTGAWVCSISTHNERVGAGIAGDPKKLTYNLMWGCTTMQKGYNGHPKDDTVANATLKLGKRRKHSEERKRLMDGKRGTMKWMVN